MVAVVKYRLVSRFRPLGSGMFQTFEVLFHLGLGLVGFDDFLGLLGVMGFPAIDVGMSRSTQGTHGFWLFWLFSRRLVVRTISLRFTFSFLFVPTFFGLSLFLLFRLSLGLWGRLEWITSEGILQILHTMKIVMEDTLLKVQTKLFGGKSLSL